MATARPTRSPVSPWGWLARAEPGGDPGYGRAGGKARALEGVRFLQVEAPFFLTDRRTALRQAQGERRKGGRAGLESGRLDQQHAAGRADDPHQRADRGVRAARIPCAVADPHPAFAGDDRVAHFDRLADQLAGAVVEAVIPGDRVHAPIPAAPERDRDGAW